MSQHSAEFLRGAIWMAEEVSGPVSQYLKARECRALLAEAEAREAAQPDAAAVIAQCKAALATGARYLHIYGNENRHLDNWAGSEDEQTWQHDMREIDAALAAIAALEASNG